MEEHDISACVLSAPAAANNASGQEARDIARRSNEVLTEIVSKHPNRFGAVATLPASDADGAIAEIGYALDTLKMDSVPTTTSINDAYRGAPIRSLARGAEPAQRNLFRPPDDHKGRGNPAQWTERLRNRIHV